MLDYGIDLKQQGETVNLFEGETPHSFRHGGDCNSLKEEKSFQETMYTAYWKTTSTANIYIR